MTLKQLRTSRGYTREYIAQILGLKVRTLASYEREERKIPHDTAEHIADFFHLSIEDVWNMFYKAS